MDNAKQHWKILQELGNDLENRVREFLVIGRSGEGVIVVTENGQGFWLGEVRFGLGESKTATKPTLLELTDLVQMAQSSSHILLLNKRGQIYAIGQDNCGELLISKLEIYSSPQLISIPHKFTSVRCGFWHSLALTEDNKVWAWGSNNYGQIGLPSLTRPRQFTRPRQSPRPRRSPRQIPELDTHRIVAIECGAWHSLALTDQGEVYAWGQLGVGIELSLHIPTRISIPSPVQSMAAGYGHTLLLTRTGEVYACGDNKCGQLGLPSDIKSTAELTKVTGLPPITQIASHPLANLSIAMSSDQRCFVWGELSNGTFISTPRELPPVYSTVESPLSFYSPYRSTPKSVTIPETLQLSARMSRMFDNAETSDVQFVVEQRTIHAHRIILSKSSNYFARMFSERPSLAPVDPEDPIVKVTIPDYSYQVFHTFLHFLYTDSFGLHYNLLPELFDLASQYLQSDLQLLCLSRMRITITLSTCCLYYQLTHRHSLLPELATFQQELVQFASTRMPEIVATDAFKSMDAKLCKKFTLSMANLPPITISVNQP